MAGRLHGKVALITGAGSGQGRAAALLFAEEGARIVGCDLDPSTSDETVRMVRDRGGEMVSKAPLNMSDEDEVTAWIGFALDAFGDFDILYNNASGARFAPIEEMTRQEWDYTIANELTLIFLAIKHAVPVFRRTGQGTILNTASTAGLRPNMPGGFAHSVAKSGVITMTENLAVDLAPLGVRVNCISPGLVRTPGLLELIEQMGGDDRVKLGTLNHRVGQPEDIAAAAVFLCSDDAVHITGINLVVDGGWSVAPPAGRPRPSQSRYAFH